MNNDDPLDALFASMRKIEPPASVRAANRAAVRAAMTPCVAGGWLSRSVLTPLPAAFATVALLLVSLTLNVVQWRAGQASASRKSRLDVTTAVPPMAGERRGPAAAGLSTSEPQIEYSETQRYLSGVGVVDRQVSYAIKRLP